MTVVHTRIMIRIPVHKGGTTYRLGDVVGHALVDDDRTDLAAMTWSLKNGYAIRREGRGAAPLLMHRAVMHIDRSDDREPDHINRNRLDNRRENLRLLAHHEQAQNRAVRGRSQYRGVFWHSQRNKWQASVQINGVRRSLGLYEDEAEAGRVASEYRAAHMPYAVEVPR